MRLAEFFRPETAMNINDQKIWNIKQGIKHILYFLEGLEFALVTGNKVSHGENRKLSQPGSQTWHDRL